MWTRSTDIGFPKSRVNDRRIEGNGTSSLIVDPQSRSIWIYAAKWHRMGGASVILSTQSDFTPTLRLINSSLDLKHATCHIRCSPIIFVYLWSQPVRYPAPELFPFPVSQLREILIVPCQGNKSGEVVGRNAPIAPPELGGSPRVPAA